ncbi:hypothetical protein Lal_00028214 [Lupinus albus]|nr:hypothetical protein Lal_00028214 [Lupinus albus]
MTLQIFLSNYHLMTKQLNLEDNDDAQLNHMENVNLNENNMGQEASDSNDEQKLNLDMRQL